MAVVEWDSEFIVTRWTGEAERMFGWSASEVLGRPLMALNLVYEPDIPMVQATIRKLTDGISRKVVSTNRNLTKDGQIITCTWFNSVLIDDRGRTLSVLSMVLDITAQIEADNGLKQLAERLASSNSELQQFAYVASHDLQEPLRMVISYLTLLEKRFRENIDPEAKEFIKYAVDGGKRMKDLIDDILEYSRVDTAGNSFKLVDMNELVQRTTLALKVSIDETGATITTDPLPTVNADESQIIQVLQNLISNAIKFHGRDAPAVHISASVGPGEWTFSVRDNGIGLDMKYADKIFQMFQRLHARDQFSGTGVGLAITKKIIGRHGGRIWVESEEGKGATFFFTIPRGGGECLIA